MADSTNAVPTSGAGTWENLYDLVVARRAAAGQVPLQFPFARRIVLLATGVVKYVKDPVGAPVGIVISTTTTAPTVFESGSRLDNECLRTYFVTGGGTLQVDQEY